MYGQWLTITLTALLALSATPVTCSEDSALKECKLMDETCRITTQYDTNEGPPSFVSLNISCSCEFFGVSDVVKNLVNLSTRKCTYKPDDDAMKVNKSTIHITGCLIKEQMFPASILKIARRTDHLDIVFNRCPEVRLQSTTMKQRQVPLITASIVDSKLSGLPRGFLANADDLRVRIERSEIPVVESRAISGFSEDSQVQLEFVNTNISTVMKVAFELPPSGNLTIKGGSVISWLTEGYKGGSQVNLEGVRFARLLGDAFNLHGVRSFHMTKCSVVELSAGMVTDQGSASRSHPPVHDRKAVIEHNRFITANGDAFINLCKFPSILWQNNTFLNITELSLRLQDENCDTQRNWTGTVVVTGMNCVDCAHFTTVDEQTCAFYQSGYCTSCETSNDECNKPLLPFLIEEKCPDTHPEIAAKLTEVCKFDPNARRPRPRSLTGGSGALVLSSQLVALVILVAMQHFA